MLKLDYDSDASHKICVDCQHKVKFAYRIRNEIIEAFEQPSSKSVAVYQIITTADDVKCVPAKQESHEELVEITEVDDDFTLEQITAEDGATVYVEESKYKSENEEVEFFEVENDDEEDEEGCDTSLDAVSFLLEKRDLFKDETNKSKGQRRIHKCDVCEKTFMRKSNLVDHLRLHANLRMYKCEYCSKEFVQAGNYRSHLRVSSPVTYELKSELNFYYFSSNNYRFIRRNGHTNVRCARKRIINRVL